MLLVEDETPVLRMAAESLEQLGYTVLTADGPNTALQVAATHSGTIDLLITDVIMPTMNGRELAERITERKPAIKRLYMSGYPAEHIARRGVLEEGVHFLQKPFSLQSLALKAREALTAPPPQAPEAARAAQGTGPA